MSKKKVLVIGGTGYLGQHLVQAFSSDTSQQQVDLAFTHHSNPPPQQLLHAISPQSLPFPLDLRTGHGFDAIANKFGQVLSLHVYIFINWVFFFLAHFLSSVKKIASFFLLDFGYWVFSPCIFYLVGVL